MKIAEPLNTLLAVSVAAAAVAAPGAASAQSRQQIWAAGSSTVFPYATRASENYTRKRPGRRAPKIESLGTGGGIKLFCSGVGAAYPDVATASRPMKPSEFDACAKAGVTQITELKIGYDGIVIANAKDEPLFDFRPEHLYLGFASDVPRSGKLVKNPYARWNQVDRRLPNSPILAYGPPPTSGTRDAFNELGMESGAGGFPMLKAMKKADEKRFKSLAGSMRRDGRWVDAGENDNAIVQTLTRTPGTLGVFGYSFLEQNADQVKAATINGVAPSRRAIADGSYPLARSLYVYVKKAHLPVTPGLRDFVKELASDAASGRGGYLADRGLIPLPISQHEAMKVTAREFPSMRRPEE